MRILSKSFSLFLMAIIYFWGTNLFGADSCDSLKLNIKPKYTKGNFIVIYSTDNKKTIWKYFLSRIDTNFVWSSEGYSTSKDTAIFEGLKNGKKYWYGIAANKQGPVCDSLFSIQDNERPKLKLLKFNNLVIQSGSSWINKSYLRHENKITFSVNDNFPDKTRGAGIDSISIFFNSKSWGRSYYDESHVDTVSKSSIDADSSIVDSIDVVIAENGKYVLHLIANDAAYDPHARYDGVKNIAYNWKVKPNVLDTTIVVSVDTYAPRLTLDSLFLGNGTYFNSPNFSFVCDDSLGQETKIYSGLDTLTVWLDDSLITSVHLNCIQHYSGKISLGDTPKEHHIRFRVKDCAGNVTDSTLTILYDSTRPIVHIKKPARNSYIRSDSMSVIKWLATDLQGLAPKDSLKISIYYSPSLSKNIFSIAENIPNIGSYNWKPDTTLAKCSWDSNGAKSAFYSRIVIRTKDLAGNVGQDSIDFHVDGTRPVGNFIKPASKMILKAGTCEEIVMNLKDNYLLASPQNVSFSLKVGGRKIIIPDSSDNCFEFISKKGALYRWKWKVPNVKSKSCTLGATVQDSAGNDTFIVSDTFSIIHGIKLIYPNGGEYFGPGDLVTLTWTPQIFAAKCSLSTDLGKNWFSIGEVSQSNSYKWVVPNTHSNKCLLKVTAYDSLGEYVDVDLSDNLFTIDSTKSKIIPKPFDTINPDSLQNISWIATDHDDFTPDSLVRVSIDFSPDAGSHWYPIVKDVKNGPPYRWLPDTTLEACKEKGYIAETSNLDLHNAQLKLTARDLAGNGSYSKFQFCIDGQPPIAEFEKPSPGDTAFMGTCDTLRIKNIFDNCTKDRNSIKRSFFYSLEDTSQWFPVGETDNTCYRKINDSTYIWSVPDVQTKTKCFLRALISDSVGNYSFIQTQIIIVPKWSGVEEIWPKSGFCVEWKKDEENRIKVIFKERAKPTKSWKESIGIENLFTWNQVKVDSFTAEGGKTIGDTDGVDTLNIYANIGDIGDYRLTLQNYERDRDHARGETFESYFYNLLAPKSAGLILKRANKTSHVWFKLNIEENPFDFPTKYEFDLGTLGRFSNIDFGDSTFWTLHVFQATKDKNCDQLYELSPEELGDVNRFSLSIQNPAFRNNRDYHIFQSLDSQNWIVAPETTPVEESINLSSLNGWTLKKYYAVGMIAIQKSVINYPNPFNPLLEKTNIYIKNTKGIKTLKIYDAFGNLVCSLKVRNNFVIWDGKNDRGEIVANGVYFCRVNGQIRKIGISKSK